MKDSTDMQDVRMEIDIRFSLVQIVLVIFHIIIQKRTKKIKDFDMKMRAERFEACSKRYK